jgi:IS30 family transposase
MSDEDHPINEETPILKILTQIKDGKFDPKELSTEMRQDCVEYLWQTEGYSVVAIANALHVSERTIKRDKIEIKKKNVQKPSADYALETIGELLQKATSAHEHLMRLSHSSEASVQEKAQAGYYVWKVIQEQAKLLQSLGYLPEKPMQVETDVYHHQQEEESPAQLKEKLAKLKKLVVEGDKIDPEISRLIEIAEKQITLLEASNTIAELENKFGKSDKGEEVSK